MKVGILSAWVVFTALGAVFFVFADANPPFMVWEDGYPVYFGATVDLPDAPVGGGVSHLDFAIVNQQNTTIQLSGSASVEVDGVDRHDYSVTSEPAATIQPGGQQAFTLKFRPSSLGERDAAVIIRYGKDGNSSFLFYVAANGLSDPANRYP